MNTEDSSYVDISGWFSLGNAKILRRLIQEHEVTSVLEIGTFLGLSTLFFATQGLRVTTIDTFSGSDEGYLHDPVVMKRVENQKEVFERNMEAFGIKNHVALQGKSSEILSDLHGTWDLVYIDGSHEYEEVKKDIELSLPLAGKILCGDDYTVHWDGVRKAVDELLPDADTSRRLWWKKLC